MRARSTARENASLGRKKFFLWPFECFITFPSRAYACNAVRHFWYRDRLHFNIYVCEAIITCGKKSNCVVFGGKNHILFILLNEDRRHYFAKENQQSKTFLRQISIFERLTLILITHLFLPRNMNKRKYKNAVLARCANAQTIDKSSSYSYVARRNVNLALKDNIAAIFAIKIQIGK